MLFSFWDGPGDPFDPWAFIWKVHIMIYYTMCCNFRFIGMNHSPEWEGKCRHCKANWIGCKEKYDD